MENHTEFARQVRASFLTDHQTTEVPTLAGAREALSNGSWDVILIDYDLEDCIGIELVRELSERTDRPRMVAISAFDEKNERLRRAGADAICGKLEFRQIEAVLRNVYPEHNT